MSVFFYGVLFRNRSDMPPDEPLYWFICMSIGYDGIVLAMIVHRDEHTAEMGPCPNLSVIAWCSHQTCDSFKLGIAMRLLEVIAKTKVRQEEALPCSVWPVCDQ